jgi:hypothetical protein
MLTTLSTNVRDTAAMDKRIQSSTMAVANTFAYDGTEAVPVELQGAGPASVSGTLGSC